MHQLQSTKPTQDQQSSVLGNMIGKCFEKFQSKSEKQEQQLERLTAILEKQEQMQHANEQIIRSQLSRQPCDTSCCPQPVTQHPQSIDLSVMVNPTITPNINIGSNQDYQQQGCRTVLAQETQTKFDETLTDCDIDLTTKPNNNFEEPVESCTTQEAVTSTEVSTYLNSMTL